MTNIAFIGLGIMGNPMAVHLVNAGHSVAGLDRSPERTQTLVDAGGRAAASIADAVKGADVVCVMVPDSPDVQDVLEGEDGVFQQAETGTLIIDFSSIRPDVTQQLAEQARALGFRMLDAPVSGGEAGAENAALSIMVGGEADDFATAKPLFDRRRQDRCPRRSERVGSDRQGRQPADRRREHPGRGRGRGLPGGVRRRHQGGPGSPRGGLAGSAVLNEKKENMLSRSFQPGFRIDLHYKDMGIVTAAAREGGRCGRIARSPGGPVGRIRPGQR